MSAAGCEVDAVEKSVSVGSGDVAWESVAANLGNMVYPGDHYDPSHCWS